MQTMREERPSIADYWTCTRCGLVWYRLPQRKTQANRDLCKSCRARKQQKIGECIPWHGHYGMDLVTPIDDNGQPVLQGKRRCGNLDCVNPRHIERKKDGNGND